MLIPNTEGPREDRAAVHAQLYFGDEIALGNGTFVPWAAEDTWAVHYIA